MAGTKLIVNLTSGKCVCVGELADRPLGRMRGLIGRRGLPAGEGLLLTPAPAIHTAFMSFSIDALFLDRDMRVLSIVERLRPWRVASKRRAHAVLELSAGECARRGVEVGDMLELRERSANGAPRSREPGAGEAEAAERGSALAVGSQGAELARLQPLCVLVISPDRQFRTVISLLLARRNCSVTTTANAARVAELIDREGADVVVMDTSQSLAAVHVTRLEALAQPVGVVLVADEARPRLHPPVLSKWAPFRDLLAAIERADERRNGGEDTGDRG